MRLAGAAWLELVVPSTCPACDATRRPGDGLLCPACRRQLQELAWLDGVRTAVAYRGTGRILLHRFKFAGRRDALQALLPALAASVEELPVDAIVAVPRHWTRIRSTGSDPAWELGSALGRACGWSLRGRALERIRATPIQAGHSPSERRYNVSGAFHARPQLVEGQRLLLVDDIATTGATLAEARRTLEAAGARRVWPAALAGTPAGAL